MTFETSLIFVVSLILLWIKPGPGQAAVITRSLNDGFFAGFCIAGGIVSGSALYFVITALGIAIITEFIDQIGFIFKLIGAAYLFYIGYRGITDIESGQWTGRKDTYNRKEISRNFITGFLITLSNPFVIFFFLGILPSIVPLGELNAWDIVLCVVLLIYFGLLTDTIIAAMAAQVRTTLADTKFVRTVNLVTSIGFIIIGSFLFYSAMISFNGSFAL